MEPKHVIEGVAIFAEKELLPALEGWRLWTAGAALALFYKRADSMIAELMKHKFVTVIGLMDAEGKVDAESAAAALKDIARKNGKLPLDIPALDITYNFTEKDVDTLLGYIRQAAGVTSERG